MVTHRLRIRPTVRLLFLTIAVVGFFGYQGQSLAETARVTPTVATAPTASPVGADAVSGTLPSAGEQLSRPQFRIKGVHYWQENWIYNAWSNLKPSRLAADFHEIRGLGFNTVIVTVPWGYFQPQAFPPIYSERAFDKLSRFVDKSAEHGLYVILRVATLERIPQDVEGESFNVRLLMFDQRLLTAYADLYRETAKRLRGKENVLFFFYSWEDMGAHFRIAHASEKFRLAWARANRPFGEYLGKRDISYWNDRWGTSYRSHEEIPLPRFGTRAYSDFLQFVDDRLLEVILPTVSRAAKAGSPAIRLGYEIRVDAEPIWEQGENQPPTWFDHQRTWNLIPEYDVIVAYFNPYWGAPNDGGYISAEKAVKNLKHLLNLIKSNTDGRPVFFDQFNFVDSTPAFQRNSRLDGEEEIADFLRLGLDQVLKRSKGYALWALREYEGNILYNSSFEDALDSWVGLTRDGDGPEIAWDPERREYYVSLPSGVGLVQKVDGTFNPGVHSPEVDFTFRISARTLVNGQMVLRLEKPTSSGQRTVLEERVNLSATWTKYSFAVPFSSPHLRLTIRSEKGKIEIDDLSLFNHVQRAALYDIAGGQIGHRADVVKEMNELWP